MPTIRLTLLALACLSSLAHAGAIISIVDLHDPGPVGYEPGQIVRFDVFAQLDANSPATIRLRLVQFDLADTSPGLLVYPMHYHPLSDLGPIPFWNFGGNSVCANDESSCGVSHFIDGSLSDKSPDILNIIYTGVTTDPNWQIVLRKAAPTLLGSLEVTMPNDAGKFGVDVLNADETDDDQGAEIRFGFSLTEPSTIWRAENGEITGGQHHFFVGVPEPASLVLLLLGSAFVPRRKFEKDI